MLRVGVVAKALGGGACTCVLWPGIDVERSAGCMTYSFFHYLRTCCRSLAQARRVSQVFTRTSPPQRRLRADGEGYTSIVSKLDCFINLFIQSSVLNYTHSPRSSVLGTQQLLPPGADISSSGGSGVKYSGGAHLSVTTQGPIGMLRILFCHKSGISYRDGSTSETQ